MDTLQNSLNSSINKVKSFTYPKLYTGVEWYIGFYAFDPSKNTMRRKRIKLNHIEKIGDRRKYADGLIKRLVANLENGWNPWIEAENEKAYKTFSEACDHYRRYILKQFNEGMLRKDTYRSYISQLRNIENWNSERKIPITYIYQFDRLFIVEFLEDIYIGRENSPRTRNNYLAFIRTFSSFLTEAQYLKTKPSEGITAFNKRKLKKQRTIIAEEDIIRLYDYLATNNKYYLLACYIIHYCFVRRKEMSLLKLSHFSLQKQTLFIPGDISKNGEDATVTVPTKVIHLMLELEIFNNPTNYYLFSENFKPGANPKHEKQFTEYWAHSIRKDLKFPDNYQFYSLKDTGITNMLRKYDPITVRDQARHSDIKMTDKYTPHDIQQANKLIINHEGIF